MPDQLPSAILDSSNSFDSLFNLELDTKQRFDNILSGVQKPIDYPIPDYNKDFNPAGLAQDELLDPLKSAGSIGEALFSTDPRIAKYATDKLRASQSRLPVNQGVGVPDRFEYSKEMNKFLNGDYGYNPYMSIADNEDFNYRYDYLNQNVAKRVFSNIGTGLGRFVGSVVLKLGQGVGYLGSMIGNGVEEIFDGKQNNFMADVADNSLSRWFEGLEQDMKDSNLLSVYKPRGWDDMGFFQKLGNGAFWTDEVADGAAFMGEMVASMYLMGGLGRIGAVGRLGATEINLAKSLSKLGPIGRTSGRALDAALKIGTGADNLSGVGRWAFATTSEAAFEASGLYKDKKDKLRADREAGYNTYSDMEIEKIAGDSAASVFKANMLILSASNAFENRFIFGPLFKKIGMDGPNPRSKLIDVSTSTENLEQLAKASRKTYDYKTYLGKKLDWKNSNSRLRFYGSRGLSAIAAEGFWEENAQLAAERLASADNLTFTSFASKLGSQTLSALRGDDPEAATSIGLGSLIGGGAATAVAKIRGGDRLFQGERLKKEADTLASIAVYEQFRKGFLNYQDIYVRDQQTGKPIMDTDGNLQIDEVKAAGLLDGTNKFVSKQQAADKISDPLLRKHLQDDAMSDYVMAAKMAGIYDRAVTRFGALRDIDPQQLTNLGFDPNTTVDSAYLKDSLKTFGTIYEGIQNAPPSQLKKGQTPQDEARRKDMLYKVSTSAYSATKIIGEYQSKMLDRDFPSVFSAEAEGNTSEVQMYNSLVYQQEALEQFAEFAAENTNFYDGFIKAERRRIEQEKARVKANLDLMKEATEEPTNLIQDERGFYYTPSKYEGYTDIEIRMMQAMENDAQKKHAEYTNIRNQNQYLVNKFSNPEVGIQAVKDYLAFVESIHKKDEAADNQQNPPSTPPPTGAAPTNVPPTAASEVSAAPVPAPPPTPPVTKKEAVDSATIITALRNLINSQMALLASGEEPDYAEVAVFIDENVQEHRGPITSVLMDNITIPGGTILQQIATNSFNPLSPVRSEYFRASIYLINLLEEGIDEQISTSILDYTDALESSITEYTSRSVELTDLETAAVQAISNFPELANSIVGPYAAPILDPNASVQQKKDALRGLSDQYLAAETTADVGQVLPPVVAEAIEALGYPVPVLQGNVETAEGTRTPQEIERIKILSATAEAVDSKVTLSDNSEYGVRVEARMYNKVEGTIIGYRDSVMNILPIDSVVKVTRSSDGEILYERSVEESLPVLESTSIQESKTKEERLAEIEQNRQKSIATMITYPAEESIGGEYHTATVLDVYGNTDTITHYSHNANNPLLLLEMAIDEYYDDQIKELDSEEFAESQPPAIQTVEVTADTEGSGIQPEPTPVATPIPVELPPTVQEPVPPPTPPVPPTPPSPLPPENSEESFAESNNYIDIMVDMAKLNGRFVFPQNMPEEVVMDGNQAKIVDGVVQLKTTQGDQQRQALRQHNILKRMGEKTNPINFWSEDEEGNPLFKIKLEMGNEAIHGTWVYDTGRGLKNKRTGQLNKFPYIVATVVDQQGSHVYFDDNGNVSNRAKGMPFGFVYTVLDYLTDNLETSRRGLQLGTGEPLNGEHGFLSDAPMDDVNSAVRKGVPIYGTIEEVTSGKLSAYNVDNSGATWAKATQRRTLQEMIDAGDISDNPVVVLKAGEYFEYTSSLESGAQQQQTKKGQAYLFDEKSGLRIPLRGKKIKDLTIGGKPFLTPELRAAIEGIQKEGFIDIDGDASPELQARLENLFNTLRALVYSQNTPIFINENRTRISMLDQRPTNISLLETEVNYSTNISILTNPFEEDSEGFSYEDFVKENFLTGALPAEVVKGEKSFEKLNRRVIFMLEKNHQEIRESIGASTTVAKPVRVREADYTKFLNKSYRKQGQTSTITVTGYSNGKFTVTGPSGTTTQTVADFMKSVRKLEEVKLPDSTPEIDQEFTDKQKLSKEEITELRDRSKNVTKEDLDSLDFNC